MEEKKILEDLKDKYFYLDFFRLYKYAIKNKLLSRLKMAINKETKDDKKKGYEVYILKVFRPIILHLFNFLPVFKPRNCFGYEIGKRNDERRGQLKWNDTEDKLKFALREYQFFQEEDEIFRKLSSLIGGKFNFDIPEAFHLIRREIIKRKTRGVGLVIHLDKQFSFAWDTVKRLIEVSKLYKEVLVKMNNPEGFIKRHIVRGLKNSFNLMNATHIREHSHLGGIFTSDLKEVIKNSGHYVIIKMDRESSQTKKVYFPYLYPFFNNKEEGSVEDSGFKLILEYILNELAGAKTDSLALFNLAKSALQTRYAEDETVLEQVNSVFVDAPILKKIEDEFNKRESDGS